MEVGQIIVFEINEQAEHQTQEKEPGSPFLTKVREKKHIQRALGLLMGTGLCTKVINKHYTFSVLSDNILTCGVKLRIAPSD